MPGEVLTTECPVCTAGLRIVVLSVSTTGFACPNCAAGLQLQDDTIVAATEEVVVATASWWPFASGLLLSAALLATVCGLVATLTAERVDERVVPVAEAAPPAPPPRVRRNVIDLGDAANEVADIDRPRDQRPLIVPMARDRPPQLAAEVGQAAVPVALPVVPLAAGAPNAAEIAARRREEKVPPQVLPPPGWELRPITVPFGIDRKALVEQRLATPIVGIRQLNAIALLDFLGECRDLLDAEIETAPVRERLDGLSVRLMVRNVTLGELLQLALNEANFTFAVRGDGVVILIPRDAS